MQTNALAVARKYEQEAKERLRRVNLIVAGLEVSGAKKQPGAPVGGGVGGPEVEEAWYEDITQLPSQGAERVQES